MKRLATCLAMFSIASVALAADVEQTVLLEGLANPSGVAVQPGTGDVFVSDSAALRVIKVSPKKGAQPQEVVTGFPKDVYGKGPKYDIGPLGLGFLKKNMLVVGGGGQEDGKELLRIYKVGNKAISADKMAHKIGPLGPGDATAKGEGNFYGIAVTSKGIYITANGDDTKGWVLKVPITDGEPGSLEPFIASKKATGVDAPVGIDISPDGKIVVGQMGEMNVPQDSLLTVYDESTGKLEWKAQTGLFDIADVAYSKSGKLYAVDFAWMDTKQGGLFRLDVSMNGGRPSVKATKIVSLNKPSSMAFGADGALYVTVFGAGAEEGKKSGQLIKITGDL